MDSVTGKDHQSSSITEWFPAKLIHNRPTLANEGSFVLLVLNQPLTNLGVIRRLWENASTHIAVDGGANVLYEADQSFFADLQTIIGDLDSLRDDVRSHFESGPGHTQIIHDPDQYSTDFGKAMTFARTGRTPSQVKSASESAGKEGKEGKQGKKDPVDVVAIGGLGGRVDHGMSQLHHLYLFQQGDGYEEGRIYLVSGESLTFLLKKGRHRIRVRDGGEEVFDKYVGILPVKEPSVISTKGLEWDVSDWETEFGGLLSTSNHVLPETKVVEVETSRDVLFTIALRELE